MLRACPSMPSVVQLDGNFDFDIVLIAFLQLCYCNNINTNICKIQYIYDQINDFCKTELNLTSTFLEIKFN